MQQEKVWRAWNDKGDRFSFLGELFLKANFDVAVILHLICVGEHQFKCE